MEFAMFLTRWPRVSKPAFPPCRVRQHCFRPRLERLEDRAVPAAAFVVDTLLDRANPDDGVLSLREAITAANNQAGADVITFNVTGTINLTGALPNLSTDIEVRGPGAGNLIVRRDVGGDYRVFSVTGGIAHVKLSELTIDNGRSDWGGGIYNDRWLTLVGCSLSNNSASSQGAGIYNYGQLMVTGCTVSNNASSGTGGALHNEGVATVTNSTLANNQAQTGGGIYNVGTLTVSNSTISGNTASQYGGGGIYNARFAYMYNSIVANNSAGYDVPNNGELYGDSNIIESGWGLTYLTNTISADPLLGPLQDNGGPTWSCALSPSSPAIDAGSWDVLRADEFDLDGDGNTVEKVPFDQRGAGYPRAVGPVDIGAVEDSVLAFKSPASVGLNRLTLRRAGDDVQLLRNGVIVSTRPVGRTYSVDLRGVENQPDILTINYAAGAFAIPGGIKFSAGGGAPRDVIAARGDADMILTGSNLTLLGGGVNLELTLAGVEAAQLTGGVGDNLLDASGFSGPTTLNGGSGDDQLIGGAGVDRVFGSSGDDRLTSMAGNDLVDGGSGFDTLVETGDVDFTLLNTRLTGLGSDTLRAIEAAELSGGDGDNLINASRFAGPVILDGGAGNDVLVGGALDDILIGSSGRDILIGGRGADDLDGGEGDDVLIGGTTSYDTTRIALFALRSEWASTNDYATRIGHLRGTIAGGANGTYRLTPTKIKHDLADNVLSGSADLDWFLAKSLVDDVTDQNSGGTETVTAMA
jgi:CSLREA domain-containing protein